MVLMIRAFYSWQYHFGILLVVFIDYFYTSLSNMCCVACAITKLVVVALCQRRQFTISHSRPFGKANGRNIKDVQSTALGLDKVFSTDIIEFDCFD